MSARVAGRAERGGAAGGFRLSVGAAVSVVVAFLMAAATVVALPPVALAQTLGDDATLSGLDLTDDNGGAITLTPTFDPAVLPYTASVADDVDEITIAPTLNDTSAGSEIQDGTDGIGTLLTDADPNVTGFQVGLSEGTNTIWVVVTAEDGNTTLTYAVDVTRAPVPPPEATVPYDWGLIPSGLVTGDKFRLVFLSSEGHNGHSTDIAVYNTFIQNRAAAGRMEFDDYIEGFRMVGCTSAVDARDNTGTNTDTDGAGVPIFWVNGNKVADDNTGFYDGDWDDEANDKNPSGNNGPNTNQAHNWPLTGCRHNGTEAFAGGASVALGMANVQLGRPNTNGAANGPLSSGSRSGAGLRLMYGLSQVFEVAAPPPPGLSLVGTSVTVDEGGLAAMFTVALTTQPTAEVTVGVTSNNTAAAIVSPATLTFTTANWKTAQQVTVTGADDADRDNETSTITLEAASSGDTDYNTLAAVTVNVTVVDDDKAGLDLVGTSVTVDEGGLAAMFTVALAGQPTAEVTVGVTSNNTAAAIVSPATLTFTTTNWDTAQNVTVTGADDDDGVDETSTITLEAASSGDTDYNTLADVTVNVTVVDDDDAGLSLVGAPVTVDEGGLPAMFTVALTTQPTAEVTVGVTSNNTAAAIVSPATLTFTTANWKTAQQVTVTGADDDDGAHETTTITLTSASTGTDYNTLAGVTVDVTVIDDGKVPHDWGLIPSGLVTGDKFRLVFLSSAKRTGQPTDIADYNDWIQTRAAAGHDDIQDYSPGFRVVGCTAAVDARDNTGTNTNTDGAGVPIYWLNGNKVADDYADFYDGDWDDEANDKNPSGNNGPNTSSSGNYPRTGCNHNGTEAFSDGTSRALGQNRAMLGRPNNRVPPTAPSAATPPWPEATSARCTGSRRSSRWRRRRAWTSPAHQ